LSRSGQKKVFFAFILPTVGSFGTIKIKFQKSLETLQGLTLKNEAIFSEIRKE